MPMLRQSVSRLNRVYWIKIRFPSKTGPQFLTSLKDPYCGFSGSLMIGLPGSVRAAPVEAARIQGAIYPIISLYVFGPNCGPAEGKSIVLDL